MKASKPIHYRSSECFTLNTIINNCTGSVTTTSHYQHHMWHAFQNTVEQQLNTKLMAFTIALNNKYKSDLLKYHRSNPASNIYQALLRHLNQNNNVHGMFLILETQGSLYVSEFSMHSKPHNTLHVHGLAIVDIQTSTKQLADIIKKAKKLIPINCPSAVVCKDTYQDQPISEGWLTYIFKNYNKPLRGFDQPDTKRIGKYAASRYLKSKVKLSIKDQYESEITMHKMVQVENSKSAANEEHHSTTLLNVLV